MKNNKQNTGDCFLACDEDGYYGKGHTPQEALDCLEERNESFIFSEVKFYRATLLEVELVQKQTIIEKGEQ